jgi:hypothetical protein
VYFNLEIEIAFKLSCPFEDDDEVGVFLPPLLSVDSFKAVFS